MGPHTHVYTSLPAKTMPHSSLRSQCRPQPPAVTSPALWCPESWLAASPVRVPRCFWQTWVLHGVGGYVEQVALQGPEIWTSHSKGGSLPDLSEQPAPGWLVHLWCSWSSSSRGLRSAPQAATSPGPQLPGGRWPGGRTLQLPPSDSSLWLRRCECRHHLSMPVVPICPSPGPPHHIPSGIGLHRPLSPAVSPSLSQGLHHLEIRIYSSLCTHKAFPKPHSTHPTLH